MTPKAIAAELAAGKSVTITPDEQRLFVIKPDGLMSMRGGTQVDITRNKDGSITLRVKP